MFSHPEDSLALLPYWTAAGLAGLVLLEARLPHRPVPHRLRRLAFHLALLVFNSAIFRLLLGGLLGLLVQRTYGSDYRLLLWFPESPWAQLIAAVVLLDLTGYWVHRANHAIGMLWRFHQVHHSDVCLDVSSAFREHPIQTLASGLLMALPVAAIGPAPWAYFAYSMAMLNALHFHHANLRLPRILDRVVSWIFVTPAAHVPHHLACSGPSSHYGTIFTFWDRLFGTWTGAVYDESPRLGLVNAGAETLSLESTLMSPFRKAVEAQ